LTTTDQTAKNENLDAQSRVFSSTRTILYILLGIFALILIAALVYCIVIRKSKENEIKDPQMDNITSINVTKRFPILSLN
uniref:Uncharacterized protein n=1 Tax=Schistosoma mansoni TaxID=6183 RepID=A0A5K4F9M0_SCHMA